MTTSPTAQTQYGAVVGSASDGVNTFKGIPFAAPPVGPLRFHPPQPPERWAAPRDAKQFGAAPIQLETPALGSIGPMSEDCLTLNVWAPTSPGPHPVLVWIYGGANIMGASCEPTYDGSHFAQAGLVVVSMNYRLGALGFLELGSVLPERAGSSLNGLRDIACALEWVRDNIAAFGGDPANVSVMGQSAGAKNLCALMTSPSVTGLFKRAAVLSGGGHNAYPSLADSAPVTQAYLAAVGLERTDAKALLTMPATELLAAQNMLFASYPQGFCFRPTVDGDFLPERPIAALRRGVGSDIDLLIGTCRDESATFLLLTGAAGRPLSPQQIAIMDFGQLAEIEARYVKAFPDMAETQRRERLLTAEEYWFPSVEFAAAHAVSGGTTHMYRFDEAAQTGPLTGYAGHGAELPYLWKPQATPPLFMIFGAPDATLHNNMHSMWVHWAKTGVLKIEGAPDWTPYETSTRQTMLIKSDCELVADPAADERLLWEGVEL